MANVNRRVSGSASSSAKRPSSENYAAGKPSTAVAATQQAKKRVALGNISNQAPILRRTNKEATVRPPPVKKASIAQIPDSSLVRLSSTITTTKPSVVFQKITPVPVKDVHIKSVVPCLAPCSNNVTSWPSERGSPSFDESMSTCDSIRSADIEYIDNADSSAVASLERQASVNLHISDDSNEAGYGSKSDVCVDMETDQSVGNVDNNLENPQLCATIACDIYNHLRQVESKKRPSVDFMEIVQKDINPSMRAILIDWLVEVSEEYRLVPDTLYLTVNYIDRYLSGNEMNRQRLQLLGVACMLIASKYEEICAPQVEEFCYITDNTYFRDEILEMEAAVLKHLKFEMTATTAKCFLRRFVNAAQWGEEAPSLHLEFLASYAAELSLLEYNFLRYAPSLIAASGVFLAKFILQPAKKPWNATMCHYTMYKPSELCECVKAMHQLFRNSPNINLPAIREKYSQHKYKFVAKKYCPPLIPPAYFQDSMK